MRLNPMLNLLLPLAIAACGFTTEGTAVRELVKVEGARAYDEGLVNSEWFICRAASVGAVFRRYAVSVDKAEAWRKLCLTDPEATSLLAPTVESAAEKTMDP